MIVATFSVGGAEQYDIHALMIVVSTRISTSTYLIKTMPHPIE
jgi:hypothetical protein